MSIETAECENSSECLDNPCNGIELIIQPQEKDLGSFKVRRILPNFERRMVGPWIFFDHMGPANFPAGQGIDVRPHPHINLSTVTYLFDGEILHRDSLANTQPIRPGDINLMVAGRGITHSERERIEVRSIAHSLHGLQLWLAMPEEYEEISPAFFHYPASDIPTTVIEDVPIRVMMGTAYGLKSPVKTFADTLYVEANLQKQQRLILPDSIECAVYVVDGAILINSTDIPQYSMAILSMDKEINIEAKAETRIAIIGGEKLGKRHLYWNFVSSRKERIEQAKQEWEGGKFPKVVGDEEEFIPLPG